jgi:hypothetical protein
MIEASPFGLKFHHLGLAVKYPQKATAFLRDLGYEIGDEVYDELQNVNLMMCCSATMPDIEVIYPSTTAGPLDALLRDHSEIIYHLCYCTVDLRNTLKLIRENHRVITISSPKPAILFQGLEVSFYKVQGFGVIEVIESPLGI